MSEEDKTKGPAAAAAAPTLKLRPALRPAPAAGAATPAKPAQPAVPPAAPAPAAAAPAAPSGAPAAAPAAAPAGALRPTLRKPVIGIRKPVIGARAAPASAPASSPAPASPAAAAQQKSVTAPIGALHKTGIVAEGVLTPAQQQAAKSKTSRISLESAMGVAPTKAHAPLKTIKMKRPGELAAGGAKPIAPAAPAGGAKPPPVIAPTQRKTLKIHKPGEGTLATPPTPDEPSTVETVRTVPPKMALKRPPDAFPPPEAGAAPAAIPPVQDDSTLPAVPGWVMAFTVIAATIALAVTGFTGYLFYRQSSSPNADGNCLSFLKSPKPSQVDWCHPK